MAYFSSVAAANQVALLRNSALYVQISIWVTQQCWCGITTGDFIVCVKWQIPIQFFTPFSSSLVKSLATVALPYSTAANNQGVLKPAHRWSSIHELMISKCCSDWQGNNFPPRAQLIFTPSHEWPRHWWRWWHASYNAAPPMQVFKLLLMVFHWPAENAQRKVLISLFCINELTYVCRMLASFI